MLLLFRPTESDLAALVIPLFLIQMTSRSRFYTDRNKYFLKETFYIKELPGNERHFQIYVLPAELFLPNV